MTQCGSVKAWGHRSEGKALLLDERRSRQGRFRITEILIHGFLHVRAGDRLVVDRVIGGLERFVDREDRRQRFVGDVDKAQGRQSRLLVVGRDAGHAVSHVQDPVDGHRRLVAADR